MALCLFEVMIHQRFITSLVRKALHHEKGPRESHGPTSLRYSVSFGGRVQYSLGSANRECAIAFSIVELLGCRQNIRGIEQHDSMELSEPQRQMIYCVQF